MFTKQIDAKTCFINGIQLKNNSIITQKFHIPMCFAAFVRSNETHLNVLKTAKINTFYGISRHFLNG